MRKHRPSPEGFTLLEILVALVILSAGILGLAATATLASRLVGDASRLTIAGTVATARLEQLRSVPCATGVSGVAVTRGIEERWTATALGPPGQPSALQVEVSVTYGVRGFRSGDPARTQRFTGAVPCR
jgi:prepilin-type N-terminal cleavage/methylation domain-containing protein